MMISDATTYGSETALTSQVIIGSFGKWEPRDLPYYHHRYDPLSEVEGSIQFKLQKERINFLLGKVVQGYPSPSSASVTISHTILDSLGTYCIPQMVNPSPEGGISLEFIRRDSRYLLEVMNDSTVHYVCKRGNKYKSRKFDFSGLSELIQFISDELY